MTLYPPLLMEAVTGDTAITYHAQDYRQIVAAMVPNGQGVLRSSHLQVAQRGSGANMSVDVPAGTCFVQGGSVASQGTYLCRSDTTTNVAITAASASNPRIDLIVAQLSDKQADGGSTYGWTPKAVAGTPAASPVAPAVPTSALLLATVFVPKNAVSILNTGTNVAGGTGSITDARVLSGNGDVPNWQGAGGGGTTVPTTETVWLPPSVTTVGVNYDNTTGSFTIQTPGRYVGVFGARIAAAAGSVIHTIVVSQQRAGVGLRRFASQQTNSSVTEHVAPFTFQCQAGDIITASAQSTGAASSFDDSAHNMSFAGYWVGP